MTEWEDEVLRQFELWNAALQTGNPDEVTALYAPNAVLIPTRSDEVRSDHAQIRAYFVDFLKYKPSGKLDEPYLRRYGTAITANSGLYIFEFAEGPNGPETVKARYTFVYERSGERWLIAQHHSSVLFKPEPKDAGLLEMQF